MDAMLVVHMQVGLLSGMPKHDLGRDAGRVTQLAPLAAAKHDLHGVVDRINRLAARVRAQTGKVILIQHCGGKGDDFEPQTPGWQFLPELVREAADIIVPTTLNDPFAGTDLQARLKELQPDRVLITGWATDFCVDSTVRSTRPTFRSSVLVMRPVRRVAIITMFVAVGRRPHLERPSSPRCPQHHSPSQLGLEQPDHPALHQGRRDRRIAALIHAWRDGVATGLNRPQPLAPKRNKRHTRPITDERAALLASPAPKQIRIRGACMKTARTLLAALTLSLVPVAATAQDFPNKPIRLIVPFPAGGPNDIIARVVGQRMSELIKQPVVIDNRGGQGGVLGTDAVAKAAPDGYTIGIVSASSLVINPTMEKVPYDVAKDFAPVTLVTTVPEMLVVASNVPAKNMSELDRARQGPARQTQFCVRRRRRPAASCRRTVQTDGQDRHRACALSRCCARHQRSARPAGADGVPRPAGAAAAYQGRHAAPDCARRSANARPPRPTCRPPQRSACRTS